jgi:molybdate transport system substrate-binding protein
MQSRILKRSLVAAAILFAAGSTYAADLTVSAAASLTNAFREIALGYERQYPGSKVALNFGASGALLQQLSKGAPVDVFASADEETMDQAQNRGLVKATDRRDFVRNTLVLIVPADSTAAIKRLEDLTQSRVKRFAIGIPASVPVGRYTKHALEAAKLWTALEPKAVNTHNVRQSLDYVARGEVDAGFVYATDAAIMKDKVQVAFEVPLDIAIRYPIARTAASANAAEADRFISYVSSPAAQAVLAKFGFRKP